MTRRRGARRPVALLLATAILAAAAAFALEVPPAPLGRVSDFAGLLSPGDRQRIEARLEAIETANSNQFAVAIFRSLEGDSLEDFSIRLADAWKVGHKGRDNGLLLLLFLDDRQVRIEVGKGLEGAVTDALSGRVIREVLAPRFREGDFAGGILAAVDALDAASRGEFTALPRSGSSPSPLIVFAPFLLFVLFSIVLARRNRANHLGSRRYRRGLPWWLGPGGGFGGGGGFGSGGGGFSGGGGSFGGGGASGRW